MCKGQVVFAPCVQLESYPYPFRTVLRFNVRFDVFIRIAVQTAHKIQKQLDLKVSALYLYIRGFILAYRGMKNDTSPFLVERMLISFGFPF